MGASQAARGEGHHGLLVRLDEPAPGIASLFVIPMGGQVLLVIDLYLYGDGAAAAAERIEPLWTAWMHERFPMPTTGRGGSRCGRDRAPRPGPQGEARREQGAAAGGLSCTRMPEAGPRVETRGEDGLEIVGSVDERQSW